MWKCPECEEEITSLNYWVSTNSSEYGDAELSDKKETNRRDIIIDHNYNDQGDTDWNDEPEYRCPECDELVEPTELIWVGNDHEEEEKEKPEPEPEETLHKIITPKQNFIRKDLPKDSTNSTIICKQCKNIFIFDIGTDYTYEEFCECPKCFTTNSPEEYKELLKNGYFNS